MSTDNHDWLRRAADSLDPTLRVARRCEMHNRNVNIVAAYEWHTPNGKKFLLCLGCHDTWRRDVEAGRFEQPAKVEKLWEIDRGE